MRKRVLYRIEVRVDPAVRRFLLNRFPTTDGAIDLTGSRYYWMVSQMLSRQKVTITSQLPDKFDSYVSVWLSVTQWDFYHYGWIVPDIQQYNFSKLLVAEILNNLCFQVATLTAATGTSRLNAIKAVLDAEQYDDIIKESRLLKHYQRKFKPEEDRVRQIVGHLKTT